MAQEADIEKCPHKSIMLHLHLSSPHHKSGQNSVIRDKEVVVKVKDNRKTAVVVDAMCDIWHVIT